MRVKPIEVSKNYNLQHCNMQNVVELKANSGIYRLTYEKSTNMSLKDYRDVAMKAVERYRQQVMDIFGRSPEQLNLSEITDHFWDNLRKLSSRTSETPIYAVDNEISRFPDNWKWWNLNALTTEISGLSSASIKMPGINSPFSYYAMPHTTFAMHHEDSNSGSINIHHGGAARVWYSVPSSNAEKLEEVSQIILFFFIARC